MTHNQKRKMYSLIGVLLLCVCVILVAVFVKHGKRNTIENTTLSKDAVSVSAPTQEESSALQPTKTESASFEYRENKINPIEMPMQNKLTLTALDDVDARFIEDGSDEFVKNVLRATFRNDSNQAIQYAKILVRIDDVDYPFELSAIPAGAEVQVLNKERKTAPSTIQQISTIQKQYIPFDKALSCHTDMFQITIQDENIIVKNISGKDIEEDIFIYYKNKKDHIYQGGITYRLRIGGLKADEQISGYSAHASKADSEVMFVTYDD